MRVRDAIEALSRMNPEEEFDPEILDYPCCEVRFCKNPAEYEAWFRCRDGFGIPTGLVQRLKCCSAHVELSIAKEKD